MPRPPRADVAGEVYHALNRENGRQDIFRKDQDYEAFEQVLAEGIERYPVDLFSYQWMPNHWHMVLSPGEDGEMSRLLYWVTMTHTQRYHAHYHTVGEGHVYQGRYKSFPIQDDAHFLVACRYVERNALAAGLVIRAEEWRWGSLWNWCGGRSVIKLFPWPIPRLPGWIERVNQAPSEKEQRETKIDDRRIESVNCALQNSRWATDFGSTSWTPTWSRSGRPVGRSFRISRISRPRENISSA
ncbi:MAG: transposase [Pirellulales bacterium]|nr:transposase [Pirellulales bacterium]